MLRIRGTSEERPKNQRMSGVHFEWSRNQRTTDDLNMRTKNTIKKKNRNLCVKSSCLMVSRCVVAFLCCVQVTAIVITCPGTSRSVCRCQMTSDIYCPPGHYCPIYSSLEISDNNDTIAESNCTVRAGDNQLVCPCTPGFYCPTNTSQPSYCCEGYYCPTPETTFKCKEGEYCKRGFVEGLKCGETSKCPEGTTEASRDGVYILLLFLVGVLYIIFLIKSFIELRIVAAEKAMIVLTKDGLLAQEEVSSVSRDHLEERRNSRRVAPTSIPRLELASSDADMLAEAPTADPQSTSPIFDIRFENVGLELKTGVRIMKGVCGQFKPRRMCAIMGPSGAGKTTIINLITGKATKTSGQIYVNGEPVNDLSRWKKLVGFVPQEDVMIRHLTVRDNIEFSANYRLGVDMSSDERKKVVNDTLIALGIDHVQHSVIGDERQRGVSGGQRKRVNIGIELVALPKVLFLDEPTSGLDSTSSALLCQQLKEIAITQGVTIASVIHQPSIQAFLEFDDLLLLGKGGEVVYHGPVSEGMQYFQSLGFKPPQTMNPADFFLDIVNGVVSREGDSNFKPEDLFTIWESNRNRGNSPPSTINENVDPVVDIEKADLQPDQPPSVQQEIYEVYAPGTPRHMERLNMILQPWRSTKACLTFLHELWLSLYACVMDEAADNMLALKNTFKEFMEKENIRKTPGLATQYYYCLIRACKQKYQGFGGFIGQMFIHLGAGLVVSSAANDLAFVGPLPDIICAITSVELRPTCTSPLSDNYQGVANFLCFGVIFSAIAISTITFGGEQVNYWRESAAGLKTLPYFLAKWSADVPNIVLAACFFWIAFIVRFNNTTTPGNIYILFLSLYFWAWSLGYLLSSVAPQKYVFLVGVLAALLYAIAFSGSDPTLTDVRDMSPVVSWLWDVSGPRWALEAFYVSQLKYYERVPSGPLKDELYMDVDAGLDLFGYNINNFRVGVDNLFWNGLGYGLLALVIMALSNRDKKK